MRYVEEGLTSLTHAHGDSSLDESATELELELRSMLGAMKSVQRSWNVVKGDMDAIGQEFLSNMLEREPEMLRLFSFRDDPNWRTSRGLRIHAGAVMRMVRDSRGQGGFLLGGDGECAEAWAGGPFLGRPGPRTTAEAVINPPSPPPSFPQVGKLVGGLSNLQSVMPTLMKLGRSHFVLGVRPEYFDCLRQCLLEALAARLGPRWTREVRPSPSAPTPNNCVPSCSLA